MVEKLFAKDFVFVNVYEMSLVYGGPEEGGWWVDCGTLIECRQVPAAGAVSVREELEEEYPTARQAKERQYIESLADDEDAPRRPRIYQYTDVNYTGGDYRVIVENVPGEDFPSEFPHYE